MLALLDRGEDVIVLDNLSTGFESAIPDGVSLVFGNVGDRALLDDLFGRAQIDAVIHFAGSIVVPESVADPLGYYHNNTVNSRELIAACVAHSIPHFIFSSTAAVYGTPVRIPVSEFAAPAPISPYGRSKLMTEWMLMDASKPHHLNYTALRYFNVAGADPSGRAGQSTIGANHLVKAAIECALGKRDHVAIFGADFDTPDGTGVRDYIHVTDLAAAHVNALAYLRVGGESCVMNCGYGRGSSVRDVLAAVQRVTGVSLPVLECARRAGDPASVVADVGLIKSILNWSPRYDDLDLIVRHAFGWERHLIQQAVEIDEGRQPA
ncbi:UDP-glucose 4-epimerase [Candidatus Phaeomarinobacter ectocarpi]|uniref:UDP-glucose 4-epimerase n=1 Tax=Candidatus Phaeomarinibacter ectocarpi TaxID=1458461 RepID=X5MCE2_9HYPH|nr:UDP-glucose 4-epimerase [Candidatus Phaeomarinobacter ectocarpi]